MTVQTNYSSVGKVSQTSTIRGLKKPTSTMSLKNKEFKVYLPSNVKGNQRNRPYLYETELSKPMDLPGEWDVALNKHLISP